MNGAIWPINVRLKNVQQQRGEKKTSNWQTVLTDQLKQHNQLNYVRNFICLSPSQKGSHLKK